MKILYFGGQKSGKTSLACKKALFLAKDIKPFYVATYDKSYKDESMIKRVNKHINERKNDFVTIEEPKDLSKIVKDNKTYLIDCISMWIFNNIEKDENTLKMQIKNICNKNANIIFVLNEVSSGIIPIDSISRKFVDYSGILGQELVKFCDEVYEIKYGLEKRLK